MEQPENGELKDGSPVTAHGIPPVGWVGYVRIWMISLADISVRYIEENDLSIGDRSPDGNRGFTSGRSLVSAHRGCDVR